MKTATVRDLRNRFASVSKWIEEGESVAITRHGTTIATLSPVSHEKPPRLDWARRLAECPAVGRKLTKRETEALWKALRD